MIQHYGLHSIDNIQHNLQNSLNNASRWFTSNQMVPNAKRTKQLLIATRQKLQHVNQPTLDLYLNGNRVKEAEDEKLLSVKIDNHLTWHSYIEYLIGKLNSRIHLLKRAKGYLNLHCRKLLFNALVKPIFEYCCSVWGNAPNDELLRILRVQKRFSRLILNARLLNNSAQIFQKLRMLPIDNVIRIKKLCIMFKIVNKECPEYFTSYRTYIKKYPCIAITLDYLPVVYAHSVILVIQAI